MPRPQPDEDALVFLERILTKPLELFDIVNPDNIPEQRVFDWNDNTARYEAMHVRTECIGEVESTLYLLGCVRTKDGGIRFDYDPDSGNPFSGTLVALSQGEAYEHLDIFPYEFLQWRSKHEQD